MHHCSLKSDISCSHCCTWKLEVRLGCCWWTRWICHFVVKWNRKWNSLCSTRSLSRNCSIELKIRLSAGFQKQLSRLYEKHTFALSVLGQFTVPQEKCVGGSFYIVPLFCFTVQVLYSRLCFREQNQHVICSDSLFLSGSWTPAAQKS